jgi:glycerol-3-phosphate dehydrogenase
VIGTTAGVRPTLHAYGPTEDDLSREHEIVDHASDGVPGLFSMIGGKLASYRIFAEEMSDRLAKELEVRAPGRTHELPLPGGERPVVSGELAEQLRIPEPAARRIAYRHGARSTEIAARIARDHDERAVVCACEPVLEAEVRHAVVVEKARDVADVARRTRLGLGACGGMRCAHRCAQIVAGERSLPPSAAHLMAADFLLARHRSRVVALDGAAVRAEELALAHGVASGLGAAGVRALDEARERRGERG